MSNMFGSGSSASGQDTGCTLCRQQHPAVCCKASSSADTGDSLWQPEQQQNKQAQRAGSGNGVFLLILINVLLFVLDHVLHLPGLRETCYLNHAHPHWWQFLTHSFCHGSLQHLSGNLFHLLVFGKMVEETEGAIGVVFIYLLTALGAACATFLTSPAMYAGRATVSVGASGAVFGLFATSVLLRLSSGTNLKRLLEAAILGNFVVRQVMEEVRHQVSGGLVMGGMQVAHVAHLGGAMAGVLLVLALSRLPSGAA